MLDCIFDDTGFPAYVEQLHAPTLSPGGIVIMDNFGSHKARAVRRAIMDAGAHRLLLPPHSPDLCPIEQVFSMPKHLILTTRERNAEDLWFRIGSLLSQSAEQEFANYFAKSGYASISSYHAEKLASTRCCNAQRREIQMRTHFRSGVSMSAGTKAGQEADHSHTNVAQNRSSLRATYCSHLASDER